VIVLDASVLIAHFDARDAQHDRALKALASSGSEKLGASVITLAECLVGPTRAGRLDQAHNALGDLGVSELGLPSDSSTALAALRAQTNLRLPDCCVLLCAQRQRASLLTFDDQLAKRAEDVGVKLVAAG
jgi:predicted nucleic acid-binding protein